MKKISPSNSKEVINDSLEYLYQQRMKIQNRRINSSVGNTLLGQPQHRYCQSAYLITDVDKDLRSFLTEIQEREKDQLAREHVLNCLFSSDEESAGPREEAVGSHATDKDEKKLSWRVFCCSQFLKRCCMS